MKNTASTILLSLISITCYGQSPFAIINDTDGYINMRDKDQQVIDRINKDDIFVYSYFY